MEAVIAWCGFAGAWLLVIGPLFQGALELLEQETGRAGFDESVHAIAPPPPPSGWWWFLPPVMLVLRRRRSSEYRRRVLSHLTPEQRAQRDGFIHKATGWFVVASGASLLAVKESWELAAGEHWPAWLFVLVLVVMVAVAGGNTVLQVSRRRASGGP